MTTIRVLDLAIVLVAALVWLAIVLGFRLRQRRGGAYLFFFSVFYVYMFKVLDLTLLQFQSLILVKYFVPDMILLGDTAGNSMNVIPLATLTLEDLQTSLLNILLFVPFGLGLPLIVPRGLRATIVAAAMTSAAIEVLQLVTGLLAGTTFRIADVNDVIFNTLGTAIGYAVFVACVRLARRLRGGLTTSAQPLLQYVAERPQSSGPPTMPRPSAPG